MDALYQGTVVPSLLSLWVSVMKRVEFGQMLFCIRWYVCVIVPYPANTVDYIRRFLHAELVSHFGNNSHLVMPYNSIYLW